MKNVQSGKEGGKKSPDPYLFLNVFGVFLFFLHRALGCARK
jgi:hypothetical protein